MKDRTNQRSLPSALANLELRTLVSAFTTITAFTSIANLALLAALTTLVTGVAIARDDVPAEIAARENPEVLEESELRYYERQYKGKCARCHGKLGDGGGTEAAKDMKPPADFTDAEYMKTRTDGQLFYQIFAGGGDACAMPAFGPRSDYAWNEEKIWHLVAFVRRFSSQAD